MSTPENSNQPVPAAPEQGGALLPKTEYVVGFLFNHGATHVALIEKQKPAWQRGKWNGIGGKIEPFENRCDAMTREFQEETGVVVLEWQYFARIEGDWGNLHCFTSRCGKGVEPYLAQIETERPAWHRLEEIKLLPIIPNLRWLLPLALDHTSGFAVVQDIPVNNV